MSPAKGQTFCWDIRVFIACSSISQRDNICAGSHCGYFYLRHPENNEWEYNNIYFYYICSVIESFKKQSHLLFLNAKNWNLKIKTLPFLQTNFKKYIYSFTITIIPCVYLHCRSRYLLKYVVSESPVWDQQKSYTRDMCLSFWSVNIICM